MRLTWYILFLIGSLGSGMAQSNCAKYDFAMQQGTTFLAKDSFSLALIEFQAAQVAARECQLDAQAGERAALSIQAVFDALQQQRDEAKANTERAGLARARTIGNIREAQKAGAAADQARRQTEILLAQADSIRQKNENLINALYFYDDRYALAVKQVGISNRYGFIDKDGNTRIDFIYEQARPFESNGFARVEKRNGEKYLIDTTGREYRLAEQLSELSPEIEAVDFRLQKLRAFPDTILRFPQLKLLLLSQNQLTSLPEQIGQLTQLQYLELRSNHNLSSLPSSIGQLSSLQMLDLSGSDITSIPAELGQLSSLQMLDLSGNDITDLPAELSQLSALQSLDLSINDITSIPAGIGQLSALQSLNLSANEIASIPTELGQLSALQSLNLSANGIVSLPVELGQLSSLQMLDLSGNAINSIPAELSELSALQSLNLRINGITSLPAELSELSALQNLNLSANKIASIPAELGRLSSLQMLDLSGNAINSIPAELGQLSLLRSLVVSNNNLTSLPSSIGQLRALQSLKLGANKISSLPAELGQLSHLQDLSLFGNELTSLPSTIGQLSHLLELGLSANNLTSLPSMIGQLSHLRSLDLSRNPLTSLPASMAQLRSLVYLHLHEVPIFQLPDNIRTWKNWEVLQILIGHFQSKIGDLSDADSLRQLYQDLEALYEASVRIESSVTGLQYNNLGWFRALLGRFAAAEEALRRAIAINPGMRYQRKNLPLVLLFQGKYEAAKAEFLRLKDEQYGSISYRKAFLDAFDHFELLGVIPEEHRTAYLEIRRLLEK